MSDDHSPTPQHDHGHAFNFMNARQREGLVFAGRRGMLKAGLAGVAGLTLPDLLRERSQAVASGAVARNGKNGKSVILLWMAGGPSHIDTWDVKPDRPYQNRGPFSTIATKLPGVAICEHLPKQAAIFDRFTLIRSVDARKSNHEPNRVFQTGNLEAAPRVNREGDKYPAIGSVIAKLRGSNHAAMPPYVAFMKAPTHIGWGGWLGKEFDPFVANAAARLPVYTDVGVDTGLSRGGNLFRMPGSLNADRIHRRQELLHGFDRLRAGLDAGGSMDALDAYQQQAADLLWVAAHRTRSISPRKPKNSAAIWQASLVPASAVGPAIGSGRRGLRHARSELPRSRALGIRTATMCPPTAEFHAVSGPCFLCLIICSQRWCSISRNTAFSTTCW